MTLRNSILLPISLAAAFLSMQGCLKVGPNFVKPAAPVSTNWLEAGNKQIKDTPANYSAWWKSFDDPDLNQIIARAYRDNVSLKIAAVNVLEARAELGIATGELYPQTQQAAGSQTFNRFSSYSTSSGVPGISTNSYWQDQIGLNVGWELDFWGKYRRAIESADASWRASLADYDAALVSLTANAADSYIQIRTLEKRIQIARENLTIQREGLRIAEARFRAGSTSQRDVEQAKTVLYNTLATIPVLQQQLKQNKDALCVLLGMVPSNLSDMLRGPYGNSGPASQHRHRDSRRPSQAPPRRSQRRTQSRGPVREDRRRQGGALPRVFTYRQLRFPHRPTSAGQSSPRLLAGNAASITAGPSVQWNILNYGQITNNVRSQDASFQALLLTYRNTVLTAQQEVEDYLTGYLRSQENARGLALAAAAARRSLDLAFIQYKSGSTDFTTVLTAQQALLTAQDSLATALGNIALNLVGVYKSLGGGWQIRECKDILPPEIKEMMAKRTNWGDLLSPAVYLPPPCKQPDIRCPDW